MTDTIGKRGTISKGFGVLVAVISAAVQGGCTTEINNGMPAPVQHADRIALLVPENAIVNWDGKPGFDSVMAQIMLFEKTAKGPKSVLVSGEVDLMLFEGPKPDNVNDITKPFFSQTFTARELAQRVVGQYDTLWGYSLRLQWLTAPKTKTVWLIARYRPPTGKPLYSSPAEQRMPAKSPKPKAT